MATQNEAYFGLVETQKFKFYAELRCKMSQIQPITTAT